MRQIWTMYRPSDLFSVLLLTRFKNIFPRFLSLTVCNDMLLLKSLNFISLPQGGLLQYFLPSCDLILRFTYICFNKLGAIFIAPWFWPLCRKWPFSFSLCYSQHHERLIVKWVTKYKRGYLIKITSWIFNNGFDNIAE